MNTQKVTNVHAIKLSYTKEQLAEFLMEELHMDLFPNLTQDKWDNLKTGVVKGYTNLSKIQLIHTLYDLGFEIEPEPDKELSNA